MPQLQIYVLGPFAITRDDTPVTGFESDKMRALLAYLVLEADRPQRRMPGALAASDRIIPGRFLAGVPRQR